VKYLFFFLMALSPLSAHAATNETPHTVGLMVGQTWAAGEIGKNFDGGTVAPGLFYEYEASDVFNLYAQGLFANYNDGALKNNSANLGIKAHLVYYDKLAPYVLVGAGLYFANLAVQNPPENAKKTVFGFEIGAGADLDIGDRFLVGLEFDVHTLFAGTAVTPSTKRVEISGRQTGFFLRGGVRF
jgi:hypothetical protein